MRGYTIVPRRITDDAALGDRAVRLYLLLACRSWRRGDGVWVIDVRASIKELAGALRTSASSIKRALQELEAASYISRPRRGWVRLEGHVALASFGLKYTAATAADIDPPEMFEVEGEAVAPPVNGMDHW